MPFVLGFFDIVDNDANLVKGNNVDAAAEVDVFCVQAIDSFLLQTLLGKRIVRCQR